ncbi:MAG: response regulator [Bacteroidales bacterium]
MEIITIGIVDDNVPLARQLGSRLSMVEEADVLFTLHSGQKTIEWMHQHANHPDIILMDIEMPGMNGVETTFRIRQDFPGQVIIMFTVFEDEENIFNAIKAGASGYLLKDEPMERMLRAFSEVKGGGAPMSAMIASKALRMMVSGYQPDTKLVFSADPDAQLTPRETEILRFLSTGLRNAEVAERLFIAPATVKKHIENIYAKLRLQSRVELVNWYKNK